MSSELSAVKFICKTDRGTKPAVDPRANGDIFAVYLHFTSAMRRNLCSWLPMLSGLCILFSCRACPETKRNNNKQFGSRRTVQWRDGFRQDCVKNKLSGWRTVLSPIHYWFNAVLWTGQESSRLPTSEKYFFCSREVFSCWHLYIHT